MLANMTTVKIHEAKTSLSKLIKRACAGEEIIIARRNSPVARLIPIAPLPKRQFGRFKGQMKVDDSFFDPLPDDELKAWES